MTLAKKVRTLWVHYGLLPAEAVVLWRGKGLALTRVGDDAMACTHIMTGNQVAPSFFKKLDKAHAVKAAKVLDALVDWNALSFHAIVRDAKKLQHKIDLALKKAGLR